jgi:hypothetical protein
MLDSVVAVPTIDPEFADLIELETAVSSRQPLKALSKTTAFRTCDWQSVVDVIFRFTSAKPSRWRETSHALKEILVKFPDSAKCLENQGKFSVGEQLLWLSIDGFDRVSVAGSLDPTRRNFMLAWRELHGRVSSRLLQMIATDDVEGLRSQLFAKEQPLLNESLRVVLSGGDAFAGSTCEGRELSLLALAGQFGAVGCARVLLTNGAKVGASEVGSAFRGGNGELMRLLWDAFPEANPLEVGLEAVKSWNLVGLRWLLEYTISAMSPRELVRLFEGACSSGSYSCGSSVLGFSAAAASHLRGLHPVGVVGRVLCDGRASLEPGQDIFAIPQDSIAAGYSVQVHEWLPAATEVRLIARHEGRDTASVNAFVDAAKGRKKTLTFVDTENGQSICRGYLDVAWVENGYAHDPGRRSFIFTLKNHLGVPPMKFAQKRDEQAAYVWRGHCFCFGRGEGFAVLQSEYRFLSGEGYEAHERGAALFCGAADGKFRAARWELWQVC